MTGVTGWSARVNDVEGWPVWNVTLTMSGPLARLVALLYSGLIRRYVRMEADGLRQAAESAAR